MADKPFKFLKIKGGTDKYHPVDETARNNIGDLSELETTNKSNLVAAINEAAESGGSDKLFECTYDVTTFSEVSEAVAAGKICYLYKTASANVKYLYILEYIYPVTIGYQARFYRVLDNWQNRYAVYLNSNTGSWSTDSQPLSVWYSDQVRGKPTIGGVEVSGSKTLAQYGIAGATEVGDLDELDTTDKSSIVAAINEVAGETIDPSDIQSAVDEYLDEHPAITGMFTNAAKNALLSLLEKVAYIDEHGQDYLDDLYDALFPPVVPTSISAVYTQSGTVYDTDTLDSLKSDLVVTATYADSSTATIPGTDYTLSGTLTVGTSTITVSYSGKTTTFNVTVSNLAYVTSGLIHQWDGINNTSNGHDSSATSWEDLIGSQDLEIVNSSSTTWNVDSISFNGGSNGYLRSATGNAESAANKTVEIVFKETGTDAQTVVQPFYDSSQAAKAVGKITIFMDNTVSAKGESGNTYNTGLNAISDVRSIVGTFTSTPAVNKVYVNGVEASVSSKTHSMQGSYNRMIVGASKSGDSNTGYLFKGKIYAIRVYNRNLTAAEIEQNYAVDVARFGLGA